MGNIRDMVGGSYANRFLVCEGPSAPLAFATACGSAFAFGHQSDLINARPRATPQPSPAANYFGTAPAAMSTMLSNHDSFAGDRAMDQFNGNESQYRLAAATLPAAARHALHLLRRGDRHARRQPQRRPKAAHADELDQQQHQRQRASPPARPPRFRPTWRTTTSRPSRRWARCSTGTRPSSPCARPTRHCAAALHVSATAAGTTLKLPARIRQPARRGDDQLRQRGSVDLGRRPAAQRRADQRLPARRRECRHHASGTASASIPAQSLRVFVIAI